MKKIYIVPSQHFDIIWRKSSDYYKKVRTKVIKKSLEILKNYPEYRFYLDQAEVLREFVSENPEYKEELKAAVKSGRFEICGGGEVLTDTNMILGESIVRNILYGRIWLKENLDAVTKGNSFIDTFGMCGQLPQIMKNFKDQYFMAGRTPGGEGKYQYGEYGCFLWEGIDGTRAMSNVSAMGQMSMEGMAGFYGYGVMEGFDREYKKMGDNLENALEKISAGLKDLQQIEGEIINTEYTGEEHTPSEALPILIKEFNSKPDESCKYCIATPGEFYSEIKAEELPVIKGEFNPIFTGCYTTRIELKRGIRSCENMLLSAERITVMAKLAGVPAEECNMADIWRNLSYVQFHDSICGCHIDESYEPLRQKLLEATHNAWNIRKESAERLASLVAPKDSVVFFNTLDTQITEIVDVPEAAGMEMTTQDGKMVQSVGKADSSQFLITVPAMGYIVCKITPKPCSNFTQEINNKTINTPRYEVVVGEKRLFITDKLLGERLDTHDMVLGEIHYGEDSGNLWTEQITPKQVHERSGIMDIPKVIETNLYFDVCYGGSISKSELGNNGWNGAGYLKWSKKYRFYKNMDKIDLHVMLEWKGFNSTVVLKYPAKFLSQEATAIFEVPFGTCKRNAYKPSYKNNVGGTWPALNSAGLFDEKAGIVIANDGTPAYRIEDNVINVTMLRSGSDWEEPFFPFKPEPGSFDEGSHEFNISILPHQGSYFDAQAYRTGMKLNHKPFYAISKGCGEQAITPKNSFLAISEPNIVLSAFKESEDRKALILRLYEIQGIETTAQMSIPDLLNQAVETNMLEDEEGSPADLSCLKFRPYEIKTIRICR